MRVGAGRAEVVVGDELHDVGRTEFGNSALAIEWIMVGLEPFDGTHGARVSRRLRVVGRERTCRFGFCAGVSMLNGFNAYVSQGEIEIEKGRI